MEFDRHIKKHNSRAVHTVFIHMGVGYVSLSVIWAEA